MIQKKSNEMINLTNFSILIILLFNFVDKRFFIAEIEFHYTKKSQPQ